MTPPLLGCPSWRMISTLGLGALTCALSAQNVDLGLYPTAVPDSFEVRLSSSGPDTLTGVLSITFALRWESSAGGTLNNSDVAPDCDELHLLNYGVQDNGTHRYAVFNLLDAYVDDCAISNTPRTLAGIRIRELNGCYHLAIVNDEYTDQHNISFYASLGGLERTGHVHTGPIASGPCLPCAPPQISSVSPDTMASFCYDGPVNFSMTAIGDALTYHWYGPAGWHPSGPGGMAAYSADLHLTNGAYGTYTAVVLNDCGSDTATVMVMPDTACVPPYVLSIEHTALFCTGGQLQLNAVVVVSPGCLTYSWYGPGSISPSDTGAFVTGAGPGTYGVTATNACGSDTLSVVVNLDTTGCIPPEISGITYTGSGCPSSPLVLNATIGPEGQCMQYTWTGPVTIQGGAASVTIPGAPAGTYQLFVDNACGSDSFAVQVEFDTAGCTPPDILGITYSGDGCLDGPLTLSATVEDGGECVNYVWTGPVTVEGNLSTVSVYPALPGSYKVLAINACGRDSLTMQVTLDSTACVPPEMSGLTYDGALNCEGSPLSLQATLANSATCPYYTWSGPVDVPDSGSPSASVYNAVPGTYHLTVSNACGSDSLDVLVEADTAGCIQPEISSITYSGFGCLNDPLTLTATVNDQGFCPTYSWVGPVNVPDNGSFVILPDALPGTYELTFATACGSVSLAVEVTFDTTDCVAPEITNIIHSDPNCANSPLTLNALVNHAYPCPYYTWNGPTQIPDGPSYVSVPNAQPGDYELIVTNACGTDTFGITVDPATGFDTYPIIYDITSNSPLCEGDTLVIHALTNDSTADFQWSTSSYGLLPPFDLPDGSPTVVVPNAPSGYNYNLSMTNACGTRNASAVIRVIAAQAREAYLCSPPQDSIYLANSLNFHLNGGVWTFNGDPHDGIFNLGTDSVGTYYYQDPSGLGCPDVPVHVSILPQQSNGTDSTITLCSDAAPVNLFNYLGGSPDAGGVWVYGLDNYFNGIYDPAVHYPRTYRYRAICGWYAPAGLITVVEVDSLILYADLDGDGLGDPNTSILGCDSIGYTANADDACPNLFGTIGSPCDDGLPQTENDVIDPTCTCVGEFSTGIDPTTNASAGFAIYPNPASSGPWTIATGDLGQVLETVDLELVDVLGNLVLQRRLKVQGRSVRTTVDPGTTLATGLYMARLRAGSRSFVQRLVVK